MYLYINGFKNLKKALSPSVLKNVELLDLVGVFHHTFKLLRSNKLLQLKEVIEIILNIKKNDKLLYFGRLRTF